MFQHVRQESDILDQTKYNFKRNYVGMHHVSDAVAKCIRRHICFAASSLLVNFVLLFLQLRETLSEHLQNIVGIPETSCAAASQLTLSAITVR